MQLPALRTKKIALIGGDGIGREVTREARLLLELYRDCVQLPLHLWDLDLGADRFLRDGVTLPDDVRNCLRQECTAVFLGALGDPRVPDGRHAHDILFGLRFGFDLYANIRPVRPLSDQLIPLRDPRARDIDFVVFRENTEGAYAGVGGHLRRGTPHELAINEDINTRMGVERIIRAAFEYATARGRGKVTMADKSNAMRYAHELWRRVFFEVAVDYPSVRAEHLYVDALCLALIREPWTFEVIVTNNLFGDIVTDIGAGLQGGLGMAASANIHVADPARIALFEPVHGSAPNLAGKSIANPFAALLTVGMLLAHLGWPEEEHRIQRCVAAAIEARACTPDVGGSMTTDTAGAWVRERLSHDLG